MSYTVADLSDLDLFDYILTIVIFDPRQKTALAASLEAWRIARTG
jgi:hypothetical protein